jgi:hypothetical protein
VTPFDSAGKDLIEFDPAAWLGLIGQARPSELVRVVVADLSGTVATATDKVIRVDDPAPWLVMAELHTYWDGDLPFSLLTRFALLRNRHRLPVSVVVILMRPEANARALTGEFVQPDLLNGDWPVRYKVIPLWTEPVDKFLTGPLGLLPLAPLAKFDRGDAHRVKSVIADRINGEASRSAGETLRAALFHLLGLRYDEQGIAFWSDLMATTDIRKTYLGGLVRAEARRDTLLEMGTDKFGPPSADLRSAVEAMTDETELRRLLTRLLHVQSWDELLAG